MNNEEKILQMLEQLTGDVSHLKQDVSDMQKTLTKVAVTQETVVLPRLSLLAEGHTHLVETLAPKKEVDELKSDMSFMKILIGSLSDRLSRLEKAQ